MEENIKIMSIIATTAKSGKQYWQVETPEGRISVFDEGIARVVGDYVGKVLNCETKLSHDGKFKSINAVLPGLVKVVDGPKDITSQYVRKPSNAIKGYALRYAVDVYVALIKAQLVEKPKIDEIYVLADGFVEYMQ